MLLPISHQNPSLVIVNNPVCGSELNVESEYKGLMTSMTFAATLIPLISSPSSPMVLKIVEFVRFYQLLDIMGEMYLRNI